MTEKKRKLIVLGLPYSANENDLHTHFAKYGLHSSELIRHKDSGESKGFGFITIKDNASAEKALNDPHEIHGRRCEVKVAMPKGTTVPPRPRRIFVARIPLSVNEEKFRAYFESFGTIDDAYMPRDQTKQNYRGIGFVTFMNPDTVDIIMATKHKLDNHEIIIDRATPKDSDHSNGVTNGNTGAAQMTQQQSIINNNKQVTASANPNVTSDSFHNNTADAPIESTQYLISAHKNDNNNHAYGSPVSSPSPPRSISSPNTVPTTPMTVISPNPLLLSHEDNNNIMHTANHHLLNYAPQQTQNYNGMEEYNAAAVAASVNLNIYSSQPLPFTNNAQHPHDLIALSAGFDMLTNRTVSGGDSDDNSGDDNNGQKINLAKEFTTNGLETFQQYHHNAHNQDQRQQRQQRQQTAQDRLNIAAITTAMLDPLSQGLPLDITGTLSDYTSTLPIDAAAVVTSPLINMNLGHYLAPDIQLESSFASNFHVSGISNIKLEEFSHLSPNNNHNTGSATLLRNEDSHVNKVRVGPRIFVGKLSKDTIEKDLGDYFSKYGFVMDVYIPRSRENKKEHRGFGFVTFETEAAIKRVIAHGTHTLKGSVLAIDVAKPEDLSSPSTKRNKITIKRSLDIASASTDNNGHMNTNSSNFVNGAFHSNGHHKVQMISSNGNNSGNAFNNCPNPNISRNASVPVYRDF